MASALANVSLSQVGTAAGQAVDMEDEDELFEINLEAVDSIPPPLYCWDNCYTATGNITLMANCLLPVADVSNAVPTASSASNALSLAEQLFVCTFSKQISAAFPGCFGIQM